MVKLRKSFFWVLLIFAAVLTNQSYSQNYTMRFANAVQVDNNNYEFDIFIKSNGTPFILTSYQCAFNFNWSSLQASGGTLNFTYISGSSELSNVPGPGTGINEVDYPYKDLTFGSRPGSDTITTVEKRVGKFRLNKTTSFNGVDPDPNWNFSGKVTTILTGAGFVNITNPSYHIKTVDTDPDPIIANLKVYLEGVFSNGSMYTTLRDSGLVPLSQPYNTLPWNYSGNEQVSRIPDEVVDWILVELRSDLSAASMVESRAVFLKKSGEVVDLDGTSKITFNEAVEGNYFVVVKHRNHLPVMSSNVLALSSDSPLYDFTTGIGKAYGSDGMAAIGSVFGMYAGDSDLNSTISVLDYSVTSSGMFQYGYNYGDTDLNGVVNILDYGRTFKNIFKSSQVPGLTQGAANF